MANCCDMVYVLVFTFCFMVLNISFLFLVVIMFCNQFGYLGHVVANFIVQYACVDLRSLNVGMSQHLAYRFYWHTIL